MKAGELCRQPKRICAVAGSHSHCDCGMAITVGGGYCSMCMRELLRGAVMNERTPTRGGAISTRNRTGHAVTLKLPPGHTTWQTTPYCRHGHEMTPENTMLIRNRQNHYRACRECHRAAGRATERRRQLRQAAEVTRKRVAA